MEGVLAMVLAGGKGLRMDVLCRDRAKPALPIAAKHRVIDFTLTNCLNSGINNAAIMLDYQRESLETYLGQSGVSGAFQGGIALLKPRSGSYVGTADAVFQNLDYIGRHRPEAVLVLAGDHVYSMDYREMLLFHKRMGADVTIGVMPVPLADVSRFGIVETDEDGRILEFIEKPTVAAGNMASMGIYVFRPDVLAEMLAVDAAESNSGHDFGRNIIPAMVRRHRCFAYRFEGYWRDIGTVEAYYQTNTEIAFGMSDFPPGHWPAAVRQQSDTLRTRHVGVVRRSIISPGCVVEGIVEDSVLSPGVKVESHAVVLNSIVMANSIIGWRSVIDRCIIDEDVHIGHGCAVGWGSETGAAWGGIIVLGRGAVIADFAAVDCNRIEPKAIQVCASV
ncbi:MAG: sugar phosphate nucleotidyltransferase [Dehalococcoidia bacterium]|nr:sugar phosphate nucleotidyltransferase [Dehalococcoidia bacterium]